MNNTPQGGAKTCLTCPSMLSSNESVLFFGKSIGAPVCAKFGKPLGRITSTQRERDQLAKQLASTCTEYGKPRPSNTNWNESKFLVMLPDPQTIGSVKNGQHLVTTCQSCVNFVKPEAVASEVGWTTALCAAKGKLLLSNRYTFEARNCEDRSFGSPRMYTSGMTFVPEYDDAFVSNNDPIRAYKKSKENFVDPVDYPTDKPVEQADSLRGIRAWREIMDYETNNSVFLPIYDINFFDEDTQKLIPRTGDDEHPEDYVDHGGYVYTVAVLWTELDETPAFNGQAGTGKTEFFRHMAYLMCLPFIRVQITSSTELDDLAGKMQYEEGKGTYFQEGRLVKAWQQPCVLDLDEPNAGQPDVWQFIRPMTDNSKELVVDQGADPKPLSRDLDCYIGMAMNSAWDPLNPGLQEMGDADSNRLMHLHIDLPPKELEREIIKTRCAHDGFEISQSQLDFVMNVADDIRKLTAHDNQTLQITWGIRPQLKAARALRWFDPIKAYRMAIADFLEPQQQELLLDQVRSHMEGDL